LNEIKEKMGTLERTLEEDVARQVRARAAGHSSQDTITIKQESSEDEDDIPEDEKDLDPTPLAIHDAAYYDDAVDDDVLDLGVLIGKLRLTERVGGLVRPKFSQEVRCIVRCLLIMANRNADEICLEGKNRNCGLYDRKRIPWSEYPSRI
jgi:hypothetical protein